jgi:hypothetical protein
MVLMCAENFKKESLFGPFYKRFVGKHSAQTNTKFKPSLFLEDEFYGRLKFIYNHFLNNYGCISNSSLRLDLCFKEKDPHITENDMFEGMSFSSLGMIKEFLIEVSIAQSHQNTYFTPEM